MQTTIAPELTRSAPLREGVERANRLLDEELGRGASIASSAWTQGRDERGSVTVELVLKDNTGSVATRFAPNELEQESQLRQRLRGLWSDLLQVRIRALVDDLDQMVARYREN